MKLTIKSAEPLQYNSMYTDYGILNNFASIPKEVKFSYSRKKELTKLYIGLGVVSLIGVLLVLDFVKVINVDNRFFYCILFFVISFIGLGWFQLEKALNYQLTEHHFEVNEIQIPWKEIEQIETVYFEAGSASAELKGLRIVSPGFDDVVIVNNDINEFNFDRVDLPQIVYMFWKRGKKLNSNQET
jgi:hypothetical protein